eukprot:Hpha_TRINITY_DN15191_c4_g18::TRINITY_DN15191_c4_g18_i1::g.128418::m.128418
MPPKAIFVFPSAVGHLNPSLPVARGLIARGWEVQYLAINEFRSAIEDTGATFLNRDEALKAGDLTAQIMASFAQYAEKEGDKPPIWALNFGSIPNAKFLSVYQEWLRSLGPVAVVVYCPVLCAVAHFAASSLGIPSVSLLTAAGPGFFDAAIAASAGGRAAVRPGAAGLVAQVKGNTANAKAVEDLKKQLGRPEMTLNTEEPLLCDYYTSLNLVSTTEELADPVCDADLEYYRKAGKKFVYVGPLLDKEGAVRGTQAGGGAEGVLDKLDAAVKEGRSLVYVSMGTVIPGDNQEHGWESKDGSALTGGEMCQAVFRAVFDELGSRDPSAPILAVAVGPRSDALKGITVPPNAVCAPVMPQVDVLRRKPVLFVTHGGQNSIMESMSVGTPVVVCPGFGDQLGNASKVVAQGWGLKVDRPKPADDVDAGDAVCNYSGAVRKAVQELLEGHHQFGAKAKAIAEGMERAGGVDAALKAIIEAAGVGA